MTAGLGSNLLRRGNAIEIQRIGAKVLPVFPPDAAQERAHGVEGSLILQLLKDADLQLRLDVECPDGSLQIGGNFATEATATGIQSQLPQAENPVDEGRTEDFVSTASTVVPHQSEESRPDFTVGEGERKHVVRIRLYGNGSRIYVAFPTSWTWARVAGGVGADQSRKLR